MLATRSAIAYRTGTYRAVPPEETWQRIQPLLPRFSITRVADITRLDEIGLPVHVAYRPVGRTLAVSLGTGLSVAQSRVSAAMESIEVWHAEHPRLAIAARSSAGELGLPYDVRSLNLPEQSLLTSRVVLDWVEGTGLLHDTPFLAPLDAIALDFASPNRWANALFLPSTNGVATGSSRADATLHALLELIERDCITKHTRTPRDEHRHIDPATATHPHTLTVYEALRAADCDIEVCDITNAIGIPCFTARIWSPDVPVTCGGFGCHVDPDIAMGRAMAEAAQSRLATVSGTRDDIPYETYLAGDPQKCTLRPGGACVPAASPAVAYDDIADLVRYCAGQVARVTGVEPFAVDLSHDDIGIPVSKVFAPGLELFDEYALHLARGAGDE